MLLCSVVCRGVRPIAGRARSSARMRGKNNKTSPRYAHPVRASGPRPLGDMAETAGLTGKFSTIPYNSVITWIAIKFNPSPIIFFFDKTILARGRVA